MERMSISLNKDVYQFVQKKFVEKNNDTDHKFRNASHFVEHCIRLVMEKDLDK